MQAIAYHKQECQSTATPSSAQVILKLEEGECFQRSIRTQA